MTAKITRLIAIAALALSFAFPAFASTFTISGWTAQAGQPEHFTISRASGLTAVYVNFRTDDITAKARIDYAPVVGRVYFKQGQLTRTVSPATYINSAQLGHTLSLKGTVSFNGIIQSSAGAFIVEPPAPPPPPPATITCPDGQVIPAGSICPAPPPPTSIPCPDGSMVPATSTCPSPPPPPPPPAPVLQAGTALALSACPALNRSENLLVGAIYNVVEFGHNEVGSEFVVLSDATHRGDGYFALYVPVTCVQFG
jgi:hypothetical protein